MLLCTLSSRSRRQSADVRLAEYLAWIALKGNQPCSQVACGVVDVAARSGDVFVNRPLFCAKRLRLCVFGDTSHVCDVNVTIMYLCVMCHIIVM